MGYTFIVLGFASLKVMEFSKAKQSYIANYKHDETNRNIYSDVESGVLKW